MASIKHYAKSVSTDFMFAETEHTLELHIPEKDMLYTATSTDLAQAYHSLIEELLKGSGIEVTEHELLVIDQGSEVEVSNE